MSRHSIALLALLAAGPALGTDVSLVGTFATTAAILSIDAGAPKTVKVGQVAGGVKVLSVEKDRATVEVEGHKRTLVRGQTYNSGASSSAQSVTLAAGAGGHFTADGQVNGGAVPLVSFSLISHIEIQIDECACLIHSTIQTLTAVSRRLLLVFCFGSDDTACSMSVCQPCPREVTETNE